MKLLVGSAYGDARQEVQTIRCGRRLVFSSGAGGQPIRSTEVSDLDTEISSGGHFCGGALIRPTWVLTAEHCMAGEVPSGVQIRIGSNNRNSGGCGGAPANLRQVNVPVLPDSACGTDQWTICLDNKDGKSACYATRADRSWSARPATGGSAVTRPAFRPSAAAGASTTPSSRAA